jgi:hypothetical protein
MWSMLFVLRLVGDSGASTSPSLVLVIGSAFYACLLTDITFVLFGTLCRCLGWLSQVMRKTNGQEVTT